MPFFILFLMSLCLWPLAKRGEKAEGIVFNHPPCPKVLSVQAGALREWCCSCHPTWGIQTHINSKGPKPEPVLFPKWGLLCAAGVVLSAE